MAAVRGLVEEVGPFLPPGPGGDGCAGALIRARHFLDNGELDRPGDQAALLKILAANLKVTLKTWAPHEAFARTLRDGLLPDLQQEVLAPVLAQWRRHVYAVVAPLVDEGMYFYAALRRSQGRLSFQDLLEKTALLLRDHPQVRRHFQQRFHTLFVDEFQDTDPIQAQVVFYLTGSEATEPDWTQLQPRPGSLFLVGDEKQSIYRFRRADVETCARVRQRLTASGGEVVELNTSFRAAAPLCTWLNQVFAPFFTAQAPPYQAPFAPLVPHRIQGGDPVGVRRLPIAPLKGHRRAQVASQDAESLAAFIAAALAGQTEFNAELILGDQVTPGDFMILTRTTSCLPLYARALEAWGIPYDIAGSRLGGSADLRALVEMVEALAAPEQALRLVKYLRGPLVGLGDDELYAFKRAGGVFDYTQPLPAGLEAPLRQRLEGALGRLTQGRGWFESHSAATAWARLVDELGLIPFAASRPSGSSRAGSLLRIMVLVREWAGQGLQGADPQRNARVDRRSRLQGGGDDPAGRPVRGSAADEPPPGQGTPGQGGVPGRSLRHQRRAARGGVPCQPHRVPALPLHAGYAATRAPRGRGDRRAGRLGGRRPGGGVFPGGRGVASALRGRHPRLRPVGGLLLRRQNRRRPLGSPIPGAGAGSHPAQL